MRLVDAEPIEKFITDGLNNQEKSYGWVGVEILTEVHYAPTVDVAPVVHGHWIDSPNISECVVCSNCLSDNLSAQVVAPPPPHYNFCPNCGARMDEENK